MVIVRVKGKAAASFRKCDDNNELRKSQKEEWGSITAAQQTGKIMLMRKVEGGKNGFREIYKISILSRRHTNV